MQNSLRAKRFGETETQKKKVATKKGERMALFDKRSPIDKLYDAFSKLGDEEKKTFMAKLEDTDKAEDEREVDKIEEDKADTTEEKDEKAEEVEEESEEIGKEVDEAEEDKAEDKAEDDDIFKGLDARLKAIEEVVFQAKDKDEESAGISGYGRSEVRGVNEDTRAEDLIKRLGGRV